MEGKEEGEEGKEGREGWKDLFHVSRFTFGFDRPALGTSRSCPIEGDRIGIGTELKPAQDPSGVEIYNQNGKRIDVASIHSH